MSKEIAPHIRTLADELKAITIIDATTGAGAQEGSDDIITKFLPPAVTMEVIKDVQGVLLDVAAAQTLAFGEKSQEAMTLNKELERTTMRSKIGHGAIDTSYSRHKHGQAAGADWNKYGVAKTDVIVGVGRRTSHYKSVVSYLGDEAAKVFAN